MKSIEELLREHRAARLAARRWRARSKSLRAAMRAQHLISRAIVRKSRELWARLHAGRLIARAREGARREVASATTPASPGERYEGPAAAGKIRRA